jgi:hypothetical protein
MDSNERMNHGSADAIVLRVTERNGWGWRRWIDFQG